MADQPETDFGFALRIMRAGGAVRRSCWRNSSEIFMPNPTVVMQRKHGDENSWKWTVDQSSIVATDWQEVK